MIINKSVNSKIPYDGWTNVTVTEEDLIEQIKNPEIVTEKTEASMWLFGSLKENGGKKVIDNFDSYEDYIFIDFDGGTTINQFCKWYSQYKFFIYTSFNHLKKGCEKFRVIMPLKENNGKLLSEKLYRDALTEFFAPCDESSFARARFFYLPSTDNIANYRYVINNGEVFDFSTNDVFIHIVEKLCKKKNESAGYSAAMAAYYDDKIGENKIDAHNCHWVTEYLNTSFNQISGNGNSNTLLYNAIYTCIGVNDNDALNDVICKARRESWSDAEIDYKIECAKRHLHK